MIHDQVVIIPASTEPVSADQTERSLKIFFPFALTGCALVLIYCFFENGIL